MSGKLDQALDDIVSADRRGASGSKRGGRPIRRAATKAKAAIAAPAGGVQKTARAAKATQLTPSASSSGESKIIISNLPEDVSEALIKDFFSKSVGSVKKVLLSYGPTGRSRGEASVIFSKPTAATKARQDFNNVKVDGKPMRVEIVGSAPQIGAGPKALQDRMAKPKSAVEKKDKANAPKANGRPAANGAGATKGGRGGKKAAGRAGRAKPKTAEELDAEMQDYFGDNSNAAATGQVNGNAQPAPAAAAGGDMGMEETIT